MMSLHIVKQGERAALWSRDGRVRVVTGPRRLWTYRETFEPLRRHAVELGRYLAIHHRDGRVEHVAGPAEVWHDPVEHARVEVHEAIAIDSHEALVIYRRHDDGAVHRRVLRGPAMYVPDPGEWMHEFSWHGSSTMDPRVKVPGALTFTRLRVIPDQTYVYVSDVRTGDDALLTLQVMIFFELIDIETMLDRTHDPIADFTNAVSADLVEFAAERTFAALKRDTEQLSELATYGNLVARAGSIGYGISKVVYRGYEAGERLQAMHDESIEARTSLQLDRETQDQTQTLEDLKLARDAERAETRRELERRQAEHERAIARSAHEERMRQRREEFEQDSDTRRAERELELESLRAEARERMTFLEAIAGLDVDLTQYLIASYRNPDRLVRIEGTAATPLLHFHPDREGDG